MPEIYKKAVFTITQERRRKFIDRIAIKKRGYNE
jgi:hypothetical protein